MNKTVISILVIVFAVAAVYFIFWNNSADPSSSDGLESDDGAAATDGSSSGLVRVGGNAVYMADQRPGVTLKATLVHLEKPGYVVIHENLDGAAGDIVGHSDIIAAGEHNNIPVTMTKEFIPGTLLFAMLHTDDGDGEWQSARDIALAGTSGNIIMMRFMIDINAPENPVVNF